MKTPLSLSLSLVVAMQAMAAQPSLTIYNQNFAVVRDSVPLELKAGANAVSFSGITAQLEADSVILRDPAGKAEWQILEQSYRNDPVSEPMLLSFFEGKEMEFIRREVNKPNETIKGKVVRSGYVPGEQSVQPIIEVDGKLQFQLPGMPLFESLGDDNILKPTLSWKLNSPGAVKLDAELAYVTGGFSWQASYNLVQPEKGDIVDLVGWVTMTNNSGTTFKEAKVKLMAGDVNKIQPAAGGMAMGKRARAEVAMAMPDPMEEVVTEKAFDEFHLYTLANPATLKDKETKQVEFVRATGVKAERLYVYDGAQLYGWRAGASMGNDPGYGANSGKKVSVYREFKNSKANKLGIPLPKGRLRFYTQDDADKSLQFVGENELDHTAKEELVRLYVGDSFDLVGERKRTDYKQNSSNNWAEESFEIKVRNRKKEPVEIRVVEHLYRGTNWELKEKSQEFEKKDSQTIEFRVPLQPDEEKIVTYKVHYTW